MKVGKCRHFPLPPQTLTTATQRKPLLRWRSELGRPAPAPPARQEEEGLAARLSSVLPFAPPPIAPRLQPLRPPCPSLARGPPAPPRQGGQGAAGIRGEAGGGHGSCTDGPRHPPPPCPARSPAGTALLRGSVAAGARPWPLPWLVPPSEGGGCWGAARASVSLAVPCRAVPCGAASSEQRHGFRALVVCHGKCGGAAAACGGLRTAAASGALHVLVLLCVRSCGNLAFSGRSSEILPRPLYKRCRNVASFVLTAVFVML